MSRTGWNLLSPRYMLTRVPSTLLSNYYCHGYPFSPKMEDRPYNQYGQLLGVSHETEDSNVLAPGAQLGKYAFESCLTLTSITFVMDHTNKPRALPEGAFCGAGIEQLCLPGDFHNIGPRACENCKGLVEVNLMCAEITALLYSTFAHCVALNCIWLPPRLTQIGKEVFLNCVVLQEVVIPTELSDIGNRAFCGCEQLKRFTPLDWGDIEQWAQAEHNAFFMCDKFEKPLWVELLPAEGPDSDAFDEELYNEFFFFPRVRTPCGHGAQVIIEGREKQSDGGEKEQRQPNNKTNRHQQPTTAQRPSLHHPVVFPLC